MGSIVRIHSIIHANSRWKDEKKTTIFRQLYLLLPHNTHTHTYSHIHLSLHSIQSFRFFNLLIQNINVDIIRTRHTNRRMHRILYTDRHTQNGSSESDGVVRNINMVCEVASSHPLNRYSVYKEWREKEREKKKRKQEKPKYGTKPSKSTHTHTFQQHTKEIFVAVGILLCC